LNREEREEIESDGERRNEIEFESDKERRWREIYVEEEREKCNKIIIFNFTIVVRSVSHLRRYCIGVPKFLAYGTLHEAYILGFGVPNAKILAYGTPTDALIHEGDSSSQYITSVWFFPSHANFSAGQFA